MLSPRSLPLIVRHFDCIDRVVATRLLRKRPWSEPGLTSLLCDLLDAETQDEVNLPYPLARLHADLMTAEPFLTIDASIEAHEYGPDMERWVTQADIGLILTYNDHLVPEESWQVSWLLQAKRLYSDGHDLPVYTEASRFKATDEAQRKRMGALAGAVGTDFVRYLLYCPRADALDEITAGKLAHLRNMSIAGDIFDFVRGLALRDEILAGSTSLSCGLFVTSSNVVPKSLGAVHRGIFSGTFPWSWFIAYHLTTERNRMRDPERRRHGSSQQMSHSPATEDLLTDLVRGRPEAIERLRQTIDIGPGPFRVLPSHTIEIVVSIGAQLDPETRQVRLPLS